MHTRHRNWRRYSALIKIIFWREFNTMYRRTALGPFWALIAPAAYLMVFIFFRLMFGLKNHPGMPMIPFLFSGLSLWLFFAAAVNVAFPSIIKNVRILKKIPVPPLVFLFAGVLLPLVTCGVYMVLLELLLAYYGFYPTIQHLAIPLIVLFVLGFASGISLLVVSLALYRQDILQILPTIIQLGMFATPIFFPPSIVPENLQWVVAYNPMALCVGMLRGIIFTAAWPEWLPLLKTVLVIAGLWAIGLPLFKRTTKYVTDQF